MEWRADDNLFAKHSNGEDELFNSPSDLSNSMPYELSWSAPQTSGNLWVFWSRKDDNELRGVDDISSSCRNKTTTKDKIKDVLQSVQFWCDIKCLLVQFWAPIKIRDGIYLTTAKQCFGLTKLHKGLCSYMRHCVSSRFIAVHIDKLDDDDDGGGGGEIAGGGASTASQLGREDYISWPYNKMKLDEQVTTAVLPLFEKIRNEYVGVVEILSTKYADASFAAHHLMDKFKNMGLMSSDQPWAVYDVSVRGRKVRQVMEDICRSHQLPLVQIWTSSPTRRLIHRIFFSYQTKPREWESYEGAFPVYSTQEGEGVVGKAFASRAACFCNNVSMSSLDPVISIARELGLTACFAVCLESTRVDHFYILEFFLPPSGIDHAAGPRNFVNKLVATLKMKIQSSLCDFVQKLGEILLVEVIKTSKDDELDSFEIRDSTKTISTFGSTNVIGSYSNVHMDTWIPAPEVGLDLQLSLGGGIQSPSVIQSNSPSSVQEMSLDGNQNDPEQVQPNSLSSMDLDLDVRLEEVEDESGSSSSSVKNYSLVRHRPSIPGATLSISSSDSDFPDVNAFAQILRDGRY